jgi:hypothetical protein
MFLAAPGAWGGEGVSEARGPHHAASGWKLSLLGVANWTAATYSMRLESAERSASPRVRLGLSAGLVLEPPWRAGAWSAELGVFHLSRHIAYSQRIEVSSFTEPALRALPNSSPGVTQQWLVVAPLARVSLSPAVSLGLGPYYGRWIGGHEVPDLGADLGVAGSVRGSWELAARWFWTAEARAQLGLRDVVSATERIELAERTYEAAVRERFRDFQALVGIGLTL